MTLPPSLRRSTVAVALLALAACGTRAAAPSPYVPGDEAAILLTVDNYDFRDATIYADWKGVKRRVGMVIGKTTETFSMPWRHYEVRFEVDFVGGGGFRVPDPVTVWGGEHLSLVVMPGW
ncbi:MAG TPA: hypothetical protein VM198_03395 [Longimicrobiales bacterium]|nr:hypothetical protein [Longimicrobiales bacterium]